MCCAKSLQSCLTLCGPMDCSPPGSSVHGVLQARILGGLPSPPPGDLPNAGIKTVSPAIPVLQADSSLQSHWRSPDCVLGPVLNSLQICVCLFVAQYWVIPISQGRKHRLGLEKPLAKVTSQGMVLLRLEPQTV